MTALHSITVWSKTNCLVLGQSRSKGKKNENKTVLELSDLIEMKGAVITMDAMNTQRQIVEKIHQKKADYILSVKDNPKNLHDEIKDYFVYIKKKHVDSLLKSTHTETDAGHGRIEQRTYRQLLVNELILEASKWAGIRQ